MFPRLMLSSRMLLYVFVSFPCDAARHEMIHLLMIRIFFVVYLDKAEASWSKRKKLNRGNRGASGDTEGDIDQKKILTKAERENYLPSCPCIRKFSPRQHRKSHKKKRKCKAAPGSEFLQLRLHEVWPLKGGREGGRKGREGRRPS